MPICKCYKKEEKIQFGLLFRFPFITKKEGKHSKDKDKYEPIWPPFSWLGDCKEKKGKNIY